MLMCCNDLFYLSVQFAINPVTYMLPAFPITVQTLLATKQRAHFHPGTANRAVIVEALTDDVIRRKMW